MLLVPESSEGMARSLTMDARCAGVMRSAGAARALNASMAWPGVGAGVLDGVESKPCASARGGQDTIQRAGKETGLAHHLRGRRLDRRRLKRLGTLVGSSLGRFARGHARRLQRRDEPDQLLGQTHVLWQSQVHANGGEATCTNGAFRYPVRMPSSRRSPLLLALGAFLLLVSGGICCLGTFTGSCWRGNAPSECPSTILSSAAIRYSWVRGKRPYEASSSPPGRWWSACSPFGTRAGDDPRMESAARATESRGLQLARATATPFTVAAMRTAS